VPTSDKLAPGFVALASGFTLLTVLGFQYLGGYQPCELCHWQRYPYVATFALGLVGAAVPAARRLVLALCGLLFVVGAGIAAYHVGVEQHWWQGTAACGSTFGPAGSLDELRARLLAQPVVRCDEVAWSLFGISMAGYNFMLSLALAAFALHVAWQRRSH
jgi:disulfide bond formation protein DsbB